MLQYGAKSDGYNLVPQKNDEKAHGYWTHFINLNLSSSEIVPYGCH